MTTDAKRPGIPALPEDFESWRVPDVRFARAYARTGDRGRAFIKSCIAALYQAALPGAPTSTATASRYQDGLTRVEERSARPWFFLLVGQGLFSPSQLAAAAMPALAARIPLVAAVRPKGRGAWPESLLTALELCGVEQVFSPSADSLKACLAFLCAAHGPGGVALLGDRSFAERMRGLVPQGCPSRALVPPRAAILDSPDLSWDTEALGFCHAGNRPEPCAAPEDLAGYGAVFAPAGLAPASARLVVEPGREYVWDWPDLSADLFFDRRLVYS